MPLSSRSNVPLLRKQHRFCALLNDILHFRLARIRRPRRKQLGFVCGNPKAGQGASIFEWYVCTLALAVKCAWMHGSFFYLAQPYLAIPSKRRYNPPKIAYIFASKVAGPEALPYRAVRFQSKTNIQAFPVRSPSQSNFMTTFTLNTVGGYLAKGLAATCPYAGFDWPRDVYRIRHAINAYEFSFLGKKFCARGHSPINPKNEYDFVLAPNYKDAHATLFLLVLDKKASEVSAAIFFNSNAQDNSYTERKFNFKGYYLHTPRPRQKVRQLLLLLVRAHSREDSSLPSRRITIDCKNLQKFNHCPEDPPHSHKRTRPVPFLSRFVIFCSFFKSSQFFIISENKGSTDMD